MLTFLTILVDNESISDQRQARKIPKIKWNTLDLRLTKLIIIYIGPTCIMWDCVTFLWLLWFVLNNERSVINISCTNSDVTMPQQKESRTKIGPYFYRMISGLFSVQYHISGTAPSGVWTVLITVYTTYTAGNYLFAICLLIILGCNTSLHSSFA